MANHIPTKLLRALEELAQERLKLSSKHNSDLHRLLCEQQEAISEISSKTRVEIESIFNAHSVVGTIMLEHHQKEMGNIETRMRQLKTELNHQQTPHRLTSPFSFE